MQNSKFVYKMLIQGVVLMGRIKRKFENKDQKCILNQLEEYPGDKWFMNIKYIDFIFILCLANKKLSFVFVLYLYFLGAIRNHWHIVPRNGSILHTHECYNLLLLLQLISSLSFVFIKHNLLPHLQNFTKCSLSKTYSINTDI